MCPLSFAFELETPFSRILILVAVGLTFSLKSEKLFSACSAQLVVFVVTPENKKK